ncbi:putative brct domain-containing protein [Zalerion maritima]|uniref:Brct domain-containing protein n=1 Tax=Zalerion maritima TaxID=339359 RepID=A0AAD5RUU0_9PEZI|nr:putative brct domain-containing protein [Zalerion maritima]
MGEKNVFDQCLVAFVIGRTLSDAAASSIRDEIRQHGGEILEPNEDGTLRVSEATHIIANSSEFSQYMEAMAMMLPVVTETWVRHSLVRGRQCPIRPYSPDPRMFFGSVVVTSGNDIPDSDREAIAGAVSAMGGSENREITRTTTHVCALSMDDPKCQIVMQRQLKKVKIVLPHWFDDCFKLGKRIDETPYLLPDPPILRERPEDEVKIPATGHLVGATSPHPDYMPEPDANRSARVPLLVFQNAKVYFSDDLQLKDRLRAILTDLIRNGQGRVVADDQECDWFICQYRSGPKYVRAAQAGKEVGNLSWIYHLITYNDWTSPLQRLLHYPIPQEGIPGFENMRITVSNYGGEARIYLENLIRAAGATFTRTMTGENTHLITARNNSEKCEAAKDWSINMINHLWLEESYARCQVQPLTVEKYTCFPPRTNLGEVIGQTFLDEEKMRAIYYPGGEHRLDAKGKRKRKILDEAHKNAKEHGPAAGVVIGRQEHRDFDVMRDSPDSYEAKTTKAFGLPAPPKDKLDLSTPTRGSPHPPRLGKENDNPAILSSGSRSAKANANARIHGLSEDILLYEKEKKRTGRGGLWGGKRAAAEVDKQLTLARSSSPSMRQEEGGVDEESNRPSKRARPSLPSIEYRICVTGWNRWVNNKKAEDADRKKLREMGIQIVTEKQHSDYLVAPHMVRTVKFLIHLSRGVPILDASFLEKCLETGELQDFDAFKLKDKTNERRFKVKLTEAIARARANKGKLLYRIPIYCTEDILHGYESYQLIAETNGAIFKIFRARSGTTIKPTTAEQDGGAPPEPVYLITTGTAKEKSLWSKFEKMAEEGHMKPLVMKSDWLLDVGMRQQVFFDEDYLARNAFGK